MILYGGLPEGLDDSVAYCDEITSVSKSHLKLKWTRLKHLGPIAFINANIYQDSPETRTWLLLENVKIEEMK